VNQAEYTAHLVDLYQMESITLLTDQVYASEREELIPAERYPSNYFVVAGKSYPRQVITFHFPYSGDKRLLKIKPSQYIMWHPNVSIEENEILFSVTVFSDTAKSVEREYQDFLSRLQQQLGYLQNEIEQYNRSLEEKIQTWF
jgi:hypothetical protein